MAKTLPYSAWARLEIERHSETNQLSEEERQAIRGSYFSDRGKAERYDTYKAHCKANGFEWDAPNEEYWEMKKRPWHAPAGVASGIVGVMIWILLGLIGGTVRR